MISTMMQFPTPPTVAPSVPVFDISYLFSNSNYVRAARLGKGEGGGVSTVTASIADLKTQPTRRHRTCGSGIPGYGNLTVAFCIVD
jgi:hypothetical protein